LGVGKIADIFAGSGIDASYPTHSNAEGMEMIETLWRAKASKPSLIFANLVDFDSLYGHRRDASGYAQCLREFDACLVRFLSPLDDGDLILITADHGNDPYHSGTDHTREQVPLMLLGQHDPVDDSDFGLVGRLLEQHFGDCE
jgi:phosphopentomutase